MWLDEHEPARASVSEAERGLCVGGFTILQQTTSITPFVSRRQSSPMAFVCTFSCFDRKKTINVDKAEKVFTNIIYIIYQFLKQIKALFHSECTFESSHETKAKKYKHKLQVSEP